MARCTFFGWLLFIGGLLPGFVYGDGCFVLSEMGEGEGNEPLQRGIIIVAEGVERLLVEASYQGRQGSLGWIIPVPAEPQAATVPAGVFGALHDATQPRIAFVKYHSGGSGCLPADGGGEGTVGFVEDPAVTVKSLVVGPYGLTILSSNDAGALAADIESRGYKIPAGGVGIFADYVARSWVFVLVSVDFIQGSSEVVDGPLPALELRFPSGEMVFPIKISSLSTPEVARVELYLLSDKAKRCSQVPTADLDASVAERGMTYADLLETQAHGRFVVEFADVLKPEEVADPDAMALLQSSLYVTRMTALLSRDSMGSDLTFEDAPREHRLRVFEHLRVGTAWAVVGPLGIAAMLFIAGVVVPWGRRSDLKWIARRRRLLRLAACVSLLIL